MSNLKQIFKRGFKRYFLDALSAMALGLFASLIIGLILSQLSQIPFLSFISEYAKIASSKLVVGAAIGVAIAWGLKVTPLTMFSTATVGAFGYSMSGPVGCFIASVIGAELGNVISGKTRLDIIFVPIVTILSGCLAGKFVGPPISAFMTGLGSLINYATTLHPIPMGILVAVLMGLALTAPISSAAIAISIGLDGLAAGAATVGCCAQMVGFAVMSYRENKLSGLISQGLGTSMLQVANIVRHPQIWIPPTLAGAILGPISTKILQLTNDPVGAGMGTSGLVGQFRTWAVMSSGETPMTLIVKIILMHFIFPAILTVIFAELMKKKNWIKDDYLKINL